jgi:signal transduction histidine kinase
VSLRTRIDVRWGGMAAALLAMPVPACALEAPGCGQQNGLRPASGARLVISNEALDRLLNYEAGALNGCPLSQIWPDPIDPGADGENEPRVEGLEGLARRSDGSLVPARLTLRSCTGGPAPRVLICTLEDLRPQRELQGRLLSAERLMSQGALVAGVVHEVNNPATLLLANIQELQQAFRQLLPPPDPSEVLLLPEKTQEDLRVIEELYSILADARDGAQRIIDVVRDLAQLSRPESVPAEAVEVNQLCETVLRLLRPVLGPTFVQRSLGVVPAIRAQRPRLFQVVLNLLINAIHAVSEVESSRRSILLRTCGEVCRGLPGVRLSIEDTGCGMSKAVLERIYEPFFTTKEAGRGTGLGLALSRTILEQHGGTIEVNSLLGKGTRVAVWLPCEPPPELMRAPSPALGLSRLPRRF